MINGTRPIKRAPRKCFHKKFGGVMPESVPDFNLDVGLWMPNQDDDNAPTECVGYEMADIMTDLTKIVQNPDFAYSAALFMESTQPSDGGADFHAGMEALVIMGSMSQNFARFTAKSTSELYCANWSNWTVTEKRQAALKGQNGVYNALGNGSAFNSILSCLAVGKVSVSVGTPWFPEWEQVGKDGILPMPNLNNVDFNSLPWHNWGLKGKKTIGQPMLIGKSWQGSNYGDSGFHYITPDVLNAILDINGTGAMTVALNGNRIYSILGVILNHPNIIPYLLTR